MSGGAPPTPCAGKHSLMDKTQEADELAAAVSSLSLSSDSGGGKAAASAADATAGTGGASESESETKWVEMPVEHLRWILAQKPEMHPTPSIEEYELELYSAHGDPAELTASSRANIDAKRELFADLFVSLRESHDDFFSYQAWVREVFERNGRVLVPEEVLGPRDDWQEEIDAIWARCGEEYAREHPDSESEEDEEEEHA